MSVVVKNTFLHVHDSERVRGCCRRVKSAGPACSTGAPLTAWEQATVDSLNQLLECHLEESPKVLRLEQLLTQASLVPKIAEQETTKLKSVLSSSSVSTMSATTEVGAGLSCVSSSSSVNTLWSFDSGDLEQEMLQDIGAPPVEGESVQTTVNSTMQFALDGRRGRHARQKSEDQHGPFACGKHGYPAPPLAEQFEHGRVPKPKNFIEKYPKIDDKVPPTTLMIRNIPNRYTKQDIINELALVGFGCDSFDFLYAPTDFGTMGNVGYVFVNFVSAEWAMRCRQTFDGYTFKKHQRKSRMKVSTVSVAHLQGLEANLRHYESAAVTSRGRAKGCGPEVVVHF